MTLMHLRREPHSEEEKQGSEEEQTDVSVNINVFSSDARSQKFSAATQCSPVWPQGTSHWTLGPQRTLVSQLFPGLLLPISLHTGT